MVSLPLTSRLDLDPPIGKPRLPPRITHSNITRLTYRPKSYTKKQEAVRATNDPRDIEYSYFKSKPHAFSTHFYLSLYLSALPSPSISLLLRSVIKFLPFPFLFPFL